MDKGRLAEFGEPYELLQNPDGLLYSYVCQTGKASSQLLLDASKSDYLNKREYSGIDYKDIEPRKHRIMREAKQDQGEPHQQHFENDSMSIKETSASSESTQL